jgi:hypothetical protein
MKTKEKTTNHRTVTAPWKPLFSSLSSPVPGRIHGRLPITPVKQIRQSGSESPSVKLVFKERKPQIFDHPITGSPDHPDFPWLRLSGFPVAAGPKTKSAPKPQGSLRRCHDHAADLG